MATNYKKSDTVKYKDIPKMIVKYEEIPKINKIIYNISREEIYKRDVPKFTDFVKLMVNSNIINRYYLSKILFLYKLKNNDKEDIDIQKVILSLNSLQFESFIKFKERIKRVKLTCMDDFKVVSTDSKILVSYKGLIALLTNLKSGTNKFECRQINYIVKVYKFCVYEYHNYKYNNKIYKLSKQLEFYRSQQQNIINFNIDQIESEAEPYTNINDAFAFLDEYIQLDKIDELINIIDN